MGERAVRRSSSKAAAPSTPSTPRATTTVELRNPADLAEYLVTLTHHGAAYTVQNDVGCWLVDITGV